MEATKEDILKRLRRVEGQIKGIHKMVEADQCCNDVLIQIAAVKAAISKVGGILLENHSKDCIQKSLANESKESEIEALINTIIKFSK